MQPSFEKILRETSGEVDPQKPTDNQVRIALLAFAGMSLGEIRKEADTDVVTIGRAVRAVRDALRCGKPPVEVISQYPELVAEQTAFGKSPRQHRMSPMLASKLNAAARGIDKTVEHGRLARWVDTIKEHFAPVLVPLTIRKLAEQIEQGDKDAIKLSVQSFQLVPTGGKGPMIAQKFEFGTPGQEPQRAVAAKESPYFEGLLRKARAKIDSERPALKASDMPNEMAEESDDDEEA